jgi:hypothetical protein
VPRWYRATGKLTVPEVVDSFMDLLTQGIAVPQR